MTSMGTVYDLERNRALGHDTETLLAKNSALRAAMKEACDLLEEKTYSSPARSAGHNARLRLEAALKE